MYAYGVPRQKWTALLTNAPALASLAAECTHTSHPHFSGRVKVADDRGKTRWVRLTELAGAYPSALCSSWAASLAKAAPATAFGAPPPFVEAWAGELEALVPRRRRGVAEGDARPADTAAGGDASCARADRYLAQHGVLFGNTSAAERAALRARGDALDPPRW